MDFKDSNYLQSVAKFHETFNQPILTVPTIPTQDRCNLRIELIQEELNELKQAIADGNLVEVADALADLQYVLSGTVLEFGFGLGFKAIFDEVQRSNMSKACKDEETARRTKIKYFTNFVSVDTYYEKSGDNWLIKRTEDDKVLKSIDYSPANLEPIIYDWSATVSNLNLGFKDIVEPVMRFLANNYHPHTSMFVTNSSAEIVEGIKSYVNNSFIKD